MKKNWQIKKLGEICNFVGGGTPSKNNSDFWNGNIPWASIKDIKGQYLNKTSDYITDLGLKKSATNLAHPNEIILATRINPGRPIITKIKTSINQDLKIVRPKIEIHRDFLYYLFLNIENDIIKLSNGTTVLGITLNSLNEIDIHLPTLETQQAIVSKIEELFSELDKGIEDLKTAQQQLKTYRQSVLKWAFEGKLTNENVKDGELPEGWGIMKFGEVVNNYDGKRRPLSRDVRAKRQGKFRYYGATEIVDYIDDFLFDGKYLLIGEDGANLVSKSRPLAFIVEGKFWVNNHAHIVQTKELLNIDFLSYYFNSLNLAEYVTGTAQPKLNQANMNKIPIPIPKIGEQNKIVEELESRLSVADKMEESISQSLQQAEALRQSILKKAFSGELV